MTLEEVLQFVEAKESGKQSAGRLLQAQGANGARSQYRSAKNTELKSRKLDNPTLTHVITAASMAMAETPLPGLGNWNAQLMGTL